MRILFRLVSAIALSLGLAGAVPAVAAAETLSHMYTIVREGNADNALVGFSVATAGDVNGDGYSDVLLNGSESNGRVWCYHGGAIPDFSVPDWTVAGGGQNWLGSQVSTAGDVNGDGYHDVMVGAPVYGNGESFEGAVYVYLGSPGGISVNPQIVLESNVTNAGFGGSIDAAGDVNGDGFDDILIGASRYTDGESNEGRLYLFAGSAEGISPVPAWTFESDVASASLGIRVAGTGDVNGDGFADVIASASELANGEGLEGRVYLFLGSAAGLSSQPDWLYESNLVGGRAGWGLGLAGDINGDGYSDVAFDVGSNNPANGAVLVFHGGPNGPGASPDRTYPSNHGGFADVLYAAGDVNGDGFADLVATEMTLNANTGAITILGGWESGTGLSVLDFRGGQQTGEQFGADAAAAGDVNGDGYGDVIVGAPRADNGQTDEGVVRLYFGGPSLPAGPASVRDGIQSEALLGYSVAQGDFNGDGFSDLASGSPYWNGAFNDEGMVSVWYGGEAGYAELPDWTYHGESELSSLGYAIANAGDVDNDGYDELLIGAPFWSGEELSVAGKAYLFMGGPDGLGGAPAWDRVGEGNGVYYGMSLDGAGDVNGDGYGDVIVGAPMQNNSQGHGGKVYLYLGGASGLDDSWSWAQSTGTDFDEYGRCVAGAGDVNGDGYSDFLIGAPGMGAIPDEGYVYVHFGSPVGPDGSWFVHGSQINARYGSKVAAAGDVNADGFADIMIGAPDFDGPGGVDSGLAEVYLGGPGTVLSLNWQRTGRQLADRYGFALGAGDMNNDGYSDIMIGAPWMDEPTPDGGVVFLYLGSIGGAVIDPSYMRADSDDWSNFGYSIDIAGDVTGDGYADAAIGQPFAGVPTGRVVSIYGGRDHSPASDGGTLRRPRQFRLDGTTPVALLGASDGSDGFTLRSIGRSPLGRGRVRLEYQVSPAGTEWTTAPEMAGFVDTGAPAPATGSAVEVSALVTGLEPGRAYHWRARFRVDSPHFPTTPWFSIPGNSATGSDLRTGSGTSTVDDGVDGEGGAVAGATLRFSRVAPNPARQEAFLRFSAPTAGAARLEIHDASGRRVATLLDGPARAGDQSVLWNLRDQEGRDVASGIYFARLLQGSQAATAKVVVRR